MRVQDGPERSHEEPPEADGAVIRCYACPYTRFVTDSLLERVAQGLETAPSDRLREQVMTALIRMRCPHCGAEDARWIDVAGGVLGDLGRVD